jgi:hypothetical protein
LLNVLQGEWVSMQLVGNIHSTEIERIVSTLGARTRGTPSIANGVLSIKVNRVDIRRALRKKLTALAHLHVQHVLLGDFSLNIDHKFLNPGFNCIYGEGLAATGFKPSYWPTFLLYGSEKYFCPSGWRRYSIMVAPTAEEFDKRYGGWAVAYHGTKNYVAMSMLLNGLISSKSGCGISGSFEKAIYVSPSITYAAHPRYSRVWKVRDFYIQMVLQVRVNPTRISKKTPSVWLFFFFFFE